MKGRVVEMNGQWLRVSAAELERARSDLDWAYELAMDVADAEDEMNDLTACRRYGTGAAWHVWDFLLQRKHFGVAIVLGQEPFVEDPRDPSADWGYGPPRYLTPDQVKQAAAELADLTQEDLADGGNSAPARQADLRLEDVKTYFSAAAKDGDAVICWLG